MRLIYNIFDKLRNHPKRVVFPEGTEPRVVQAAAEYVRQRLGVAILLGKRAAVEDAALHSGASLKHILIIDPETADDLQLFLERLSLLPRYKGIKEDEARRIVIQPNYFSAMMLQHGQADAMVGGATAAAGSILRPLFQIIRPLRGVKSISSCMVIEVPDCPYGDHGVFVFADCGVIPRPTMEQLASIASEAAKLRRQIGGHDKPRVAMLSYSTKGSAQTEDTERIVGATKLARDHFIDHNLDIEIDGELQVDAALIRSVGEFKAQNSPVAGRANVLVFPDLNSGNIAAKLVQRLARARAYGQILLGLEKPAADLSRGALVEDIVGVAALVGLQAIHYRKLYPEQGAAKRYTEWVKPRSDPSNAVPAPQIPDSA
jgi:phosphate acetyltransferase